MPQVQTRYALNASTHIAYQGVGQGSIDLVFVPGFPSNIDVLWDDLGFVRLMRRLSTFARVLVFDQRGTGLSDPVDPSNPPDAASTASDIGAVMDAAGSHRAALLAASDSVPAAILFAALCPDRTRALVLYGGYAWEGDGPPFIRTGDGLEDVERRWGTGALLRHAVPSRATEPAFTAWWARLERLSASPSTARLQLSRASTADARSVLPLVACPTLVLHRQKDSFVPVSAGAALAAEIKGAKLVELPGRDHPIWIEPVDELVDGIEMFLTGSRTVGADRVLSTLVVVRLINAERSAAAMGAFAWRQTLDRLHEMAGRLAGEGGGRRLSSGASMIRLRFDRPSRAIQCAEALRRNLLAVSLHVAIGIHTGEFDLGDEDLTGIGSLIAERIAFAAARDDIVVSAPIVDLVLGSAIRFRPFGTLMIDGIEAPIGLCRIEEEQHLEPRPHAREPDLSVLSPRERQVLRLIATGLSNAAIALDLNLSEHTVKRHVANILDKLDLPTRAAAAVIAARDGP